MSSEISVSLEAIVGLLLSVSIASERLVEIIKGIIPWLNDASLDPVNEGRRKATLQFLAVASGILTAFLAEPVLAPSLSGMSNNNAGILAVGLLASGGSGFWNAILSYLLQVKDLKKQEVKIAQGETLPSSANLLPELNLGTEQVTSNECYDVGEK